MGPEEKLLSNLMKATCGFCAACVGGSIEEAGARSMSIVHQHVGGGTTLRIEGDEALASWLSSILESYDQMGQAGWDLTRLHELWEAPPRG